MLVTVESNVDVSITGARSLVLVKVESNVADRVDDIVSVVAKVVSAAEIVDGFVVLVVLEDEREEVDTAAVPVVDIVGVDGFVVLVVLEDEREGVDTAAVLVVDIVGVDGA